MKKTVQRIWNAATTLLVVLAVVLAVLLVGVRLFGLQVYTVLSGSMEPTYPTGSLLYVRSVQGEADIQPGTAITFQMDSGMVATHRVVEVVTKDGAVFYRTKGDANQVVDGSLVAPVRVLGTPVFCIPYLGFLAAYLRSRPGRWLLVSAGVLLVLLVVLHDLLFSKAPKEQPPHSSVDQPK